MTENIPRAAEPESMPPNRPVHSLRKDLIVSEQHQRGRHYAVIKDPVSAEFFRLTWTDFELAKLLEGCPTFVHWIARWQKQYPSLRTQPPERLAEKARSLLASVESKGLCNLPADKALHYRTMREKQKKKTAWLRGLTSWLMIRKALFDPDALLSVVTPRVGFLFKPWFTGACLLLFFGAVYLLVANRRDIAMDFSWFLSLGNLALFFLCMVVMKVIHEFGHGITCKHYGGEVHEAGFMMMALHPLFYVNVSDAWLMPKKSHRIYVSSAGIYVELIFAVLLTYLWAVLAPGFFKQLAFNCIVVASVATVYFNANPLMRFDGYYILADWLEIPNLRQRSMQFIGAKFRRLFFGRNSQMAALSPEIVEQSKSLAIYAGLSLLYLIFVMWNVLHMLDSLLDTVGLRFVAHILVLMWITASLGFPIIMFFLRTLGDKRISLSAGQRRRPLLVLLLGGLLATAILWIPWQKTVTRSCVFQYANPYEIRAEQPGFVLEVLREEGDAVTQGEIVARLRNPEIENLLATQKEALREVEMLLNQAQNEDKAQDYELFRRKRSELLAGLHEIEQKHAALQLRSGSGGRILTRNLRDLQGRYLKAGELLATIGPDTNFDILVPLAEREARFVKSGDPAQLRVLAVPSETFHGRVVQKPLTTISGKLPAALTTRRGGDVVSTVDTSGKELLLEKQWFAILNIDEPDRLLRPGMTGKVRIDCGPSTVGRLMGQRFLDLINLDYRL